MVDRSFAGIMHLPTWLDLCSVRFTEDARALLLRGKPSQCSALLLLASHVVTGGHLEYDLGLQLPSARRHRSALSRAARVVRALDGGYRRLARMEDPERAAIGAPEKKVVQFAARDQTQSLVSSKKCYTITVSLRNQIYGM